MNSEERKEFFEQRKQLIDLQHQASQDFDKTVVTLAGGALGLSLTFIRQIIPEALPNTTIFLALSWLLLVLCLLSTLLSLFTSQVGMIRACEELEILYKVNSRHQSQSQYLFKRIYGQIARKLFDFFGHRSVTQFLNIASIIFLVAGLALLAWFVLQNIPQVQLPLQSGYRNEGSFYGKR